MDKDKVEVETTVHSYEDAEVETTIRSYEETRVATKVHSYEDDKSEAMKASTIDTCMGRPEVETTTMV